MMVKDLAALDEAIVLVVAARPGGLVLPDGAAFEPVHISLWRLGFVRLFAPTSGSKRLVATAAGLRAIGKAPAPLRAVQ